MDKEDRAKQFLPFDALNGLQEALREKEIEYVEKKELSEDMAEELSEKLQMLEINDIVKVTYYSNRLYKTITGKVKYKDSVKKKLIIDETRINFMDIISVERL